ncbi:LytTR family DNA-binding domain-containing protein [Nocardioides sp.]|jgi:DNA-binding LytR/AlgR family response regulator|uniref:LytR/AlgR family response regulator transcription factor n=1 Tax=Nocardioides sp. TaxID=35761 RepID=UPI002F3FD30F
MTDGYGLKVLAVDDEPPALDELAFLLGRDDRVSEVQTCGSATQALRLLRDGAFDLVLLDIAMPGLSGLELARVLRQFRQSPAVVFVTAHAHHAVDAFDLRAVDYLLKPVHEDRLREAIDRVRDEPAGHDPDEQVAVELAGVTRFVRRSEVRYASAQGDYVRLHTATENPLVRMPLAALEQRWAEAGFVRIHRSLLVSLDHVDEVRLGGARPTVVVAGIELPVSRRHVPDVRSLVRRTRNGEA